MANSFPVCRTSPKRCGTDASCLVVARPETALFFRTASNRSLSQSQERASSASSSVTQMHLRTVPRISSCDPTNGRMNFDCTPWLAIALAADHAAEGDAPSGTVYVLRSRSDHPLVAQNRDLVHKIGVTHMSVERRIAGAHLQPTFLMAKVDIVATYDLYNIDRSRLERLIHRVFEPARLDIEVPDRFGRPVAPQEWFLVPLHVIDEAVARIRDETIGTCVYDPESAALVDV